MALLFSTSESKILSIHDSSHLSAENPSATSHTRSVHFRKPLSLSSHFDIACLPLFLLRPVHPHQRFDRLLPLRLRDFHLSPEAGDARMRRAWTCIDVRARAPQPTAVYVGRVAMLGGWSSGGGSDCGRIGGVVGFLGGRGGIECFLEVVLDLYGELKWKVQSN